jgi:hypothetical protein
MITADGASATSRAPRDAAVIATITQATEDTKVTEATPDAHRLIGPPLPADRHRPFRGAPEAADFLIRSLV